jgi:hypothetical protein
MIVCYVILGLLLLAFIGIVGCLVKATLDYRKEFKKCRKNGRFDSYELIKKKSILEELERMLLVFLAAILLTSLITCVIDRNQRDVDEPETDSSIMETEPEIEEPAEPEVTEPIEEPTEPETTEATEPATEEPTEEPTEPEPTEPPIDPYDLELLALVIYQEAGGSAHCDECRRRVADVVLNRVADSRFPDTIEDVLLEKYQYGLLWQTGIVWPARRNDPNEKYAVERAYRIAEEVLSGNHSEVYGEGYVWQAEFVQGKGGFWCCGHFFGHG